MIPTLQDIDEREKGAFPVSIGTSLALEGACGIYPERPETPAPITQGVREIWINVRTLWRNLVGSLRTEVRDAVMPNMLYSALREELSIIEGVVSKASEGMVSVVYYHCEYTDLPRRFTKALLKYPKTEKQLVTQALEMNTIGMLMADAGSHDIRRFKTDIVGKGPDSWMISHFPIDLLSKASFKSLKLLESHTGVLKGPSAWYTKLSNGKDLAHIPFCAFSLQVFGDGPTQFNQMPIAVREQVLAIADANAWTSVTTRDRITLCIKGVSDPTMRTLLLTLL